MYLGLDSLIGCHFVITPDEKELRQIENMIYMVSGCKASAKYSTKWSHKNKNEEYVGECNDYEIDFQLHINEKLNRFCNYLVGNNKRYIVITGISARGGNDGTV